MEVFFMWNGNEPSQAYYVEKGNKRSGHDALDHFAHFAMLAVWLCK